VPGEFIELGEGASVNKFGDALARRHLSLGMLFLDGSLGSSMDGLIQSVAKVLNFSRSCMQITAHAPTVLGVSPFGVPLDSQNINARVKTSYWRVNVVESTGSTQVDLVKKVRDGVATHGDVLATEFQSAGRGRLDRTFIAPARSALLFSFYIQPKCDGERWGWLPLLAGQSVRHAVSEVLDIRGDDSVKLKWPNDILLNDRKVAGLLAERVEIPSATGVVIGVGINVHTRQEELPVPSATSFALQGYSECDRNELLTHILQSFSDHLERWENEDSSLLIEYANVSATLGRQVSIEIPGQSNVVSVATGIDPSGALVLEDGRRITVGDVIHINAL
jgi:BirA family biotin operon repressor/biotin-[acetyl-CoA-carboxylase] ligase